MNSVNNTPKGEMQKKLKEILDTEEYRHQYAHFFDGTTKILSSTELEVIYPILMTNILSNTRIRENPQAEILKTRPICPITGPKKLNQAKKEYKIPMIVYLAQFGIHLTDNAPCNYPPALLEALANYCEKNIGK